MLKVQCILQSIPFRKWCPSCKKKSIALCYTSICMVILWSKECSCKFDALNLTFEFLVSFLMAHVGMVWMKWTLLNRWNQTRLNPYELHPTSRCRPFCRVYCLHFGWKTACTGWTSKRRGPVELWCIVAWKFRECIFFDCVFISLTWHRYSYTLEASFAGFDSSRQGELLSANVWIFPTLSTGSFHFDHKSFMNAGRSIVSDFAGYDESKCATSADAWRAGGKHRPVEEPRRRPPARGALHGGCKSSRYGS